MELQKIIDGLKAHIYGAASYEYKSVDEAIRVLETMRDIDSQKVCKGLECCEPYLQHCYQDQCPYYKDNGCLDSQRADALSLIRQQQECIKALEAGQTARLITEADFEKADAWGIIPAWIEYRPELESAEDGWALIDCDVFHNVFKRAWTQRPTYEQSEAVKWE